VLESAQQRAIAATAAHNSPKRKARLSRLGAITIEHHTDWRDFGGEFPNFVNAHVARFASQGKTSSLVLPSRRLFLEELGRLLSEQGILRCSVLRLGGKPVAWHFGMAFHGKWFWYQPAFDLDCDQASPGTYLLREVIQEAARNPDFRGVDLGLGDESYKREYANSVQQTLHFTLEISKIRMARQMSRYYLAQALRQSPKLERLARAAVSRITASREAITKNENTQTTRQLSNECGD
jgi:CelD/BcsL family acetyltransferase involved in cellulose biosynthesis